MNSIMTSDELGKEGKFLSALNVSPESFVHKALKDEQIECIHRVVCHGRDVLAVLPTGLGKSAIYQLISKVLFLMGRTANATSKTTAELLVFCWLLACVAGVRRGRKEERRAREAREDRTREDRDRGRLQGRYCFLYSAPN